MKEVVCELIVADQPTTNGRIYRRDALEKALYEYNKLPERLVSSDFDEGTTLSIRKVVGRAYDFKLNEDGKITAKIEFIPETHGEMLEKMMDHLDFSPMSSGREDEDGVVHDLKFCYFALTPKDGE